MPEEPIKKEEQKSTEQSTDEIASSRQVGTRNDKFSSVAADAKTTETDKATEDNSFFKESELEKCRRERDEYLNGWKRAKADFLNYQKDERKRMEEFLKWAQASLIEDLLPALDSFDLALAQIGQTNDVKYKGFFLIKSQLDDILRKRGLEVIKSVGEKFNPEFHEAMAMIEDSSKESQIIVEEIQKGYTLNGKVLRPSKVKLIK